MAQQLPLFLPESSWIEPTKLPVIPSNVILAIDTETRDNMLARDQGPGWVHNDGYIVGVSVAWQTTTSGIESCYIPLRHPDSQNFDVGETMRWLQDAIDRSRKLVFHNISYDAGWLLTDNVQTDFDKSEDTQSMSVMLDENRFVYSLDDCCKHENVIGKDEAKLNEAANIFNLDPKKELWKLPAKYVGLYAEQDAIATLNLYLKLIPKLEEDQITEAYRLEMNLVPMFIDMRKQGIPVNENTADIVRKNLRIKRDELLKETTRKLGWSKLVTMGDMNSAKSLEKMFNDEGVNFPRTGITKVGSFTSDWLGAHEHWLPKSVTAIRQLNDLSEKFITNYILGSTHLGKIHAEIHQLRDGKSGTRTYRLSYSNPPLQQIPSRTAEGKLIRTIFEAGKDTMWYSSDYSQQEPRIAVHFASVCNLVGAEDAIRYYSDDPKADFHTMVAEMTGLTRSQAKIINLGLMYGMGLAKLAHDLRVPVDKAIEIINQYNDRMPFVKNLDKFCKNRADSRGYIKLIDGARCRFDKWELAWGSNSAPVSYEKALEMYPGKRIVRAATRTAMNKLVQGSAARQTKKAMLDCYRENLLPLIQMHDELGFPINDPKMGERASEIMKDAFRLKVPMAVDGQYGWTWGQASEEIKGVSPLSFEELIKYGKTETSKHIIEMRS